MKKDTKPFGYAEAVEMLNKYMPPESLKKWREEMKAGTFRPQKHNVEEKISDLFESALVQWWIETESG